MRTSSPGEAAAELIFFRLKRRVLVLLDGPGDVLSSSASAIFLEDVVPLRGVR